MPRHIDQDRRRTEIAEAVWRLVVREGVSAVSLRTVAAEAGLVLGSLRHSFPTKADLLAYSMELVHERVQERVRRHLGVRDARALARAVLLEVLPLDEERRTELRVNLALVVESPAHPRLAELAGAAQTALAQMCRDLCGHLGSAGLLHPSRDVALEGARLHALLDGTALHLLLDPAAVPSAEQLVEAHLRELATPSPEAGPASGAARR